MGCKLRINMMLEEDGLGVDKLERRGQKFTPLPEESSPHQELFSSKVIINPQPNDISPVPE